MGRGKTLLLEYNFCLVWDLRNIFKKIEALREHRPPWLKQIITPVSCVWRDVRLPGSNNVTMHCIALPWWWKANPKSSGSLPAPWSGHATAIMFFTHLLILEDPYHHQNLISSSLYHPRPLGKISAQSVHKFLNNVYKQTDRHTNYTKNITSFCQGGNKIIINSKFCLSMTALTQSTLTLNRHHIPLWNQDHPKFENIPVNFRSN